MSKATNPENEIGELVAAKIGEQHQALSLEHWSEIKETMDRDDDHEVKVTFTTTLTNRPAEPGTVASKDSRILTTVAWSLGRKTAKMESPFPLAGQPELPTN